MNDIPGHIDALDASTSLEMVDETSGGYRTELSWRRAGRAQLGEYEAFRLAERSFFNEVCLIQSSFKEDQFLRIAKKYVKYEYNVRRQQEKNLLDSDILPQVDILIKLVGVIIKISLTGGCGVPSLLQH